MQHTFGLVLRAGPGPGVVPIWPWSRSVRSQHSPTFPTAGISAMPIFSLPSLNYRLTPRDAGSQFTVVRTHYRRDSTS